MIPEKGSPPQVRGKAFFQMSIKKPPRITPAGAGKSSAPVPPHTPLKDHPRRCGEKWGILRLYSPIKGSPPQVRGKVPFSVTEPKVMRITPAGAGKSSGGEVCAECPQDHPRRCGEKQRQYKSTQSAGGSPPQVRGKVICQSNAAKAGRITPAGAGKSRNSWTMMKQ